MAEVKPLNASDKPKEVSEQSENADYFLRNLFIPADAGGNLGLHLSRTPWDPYPWVSGVLTGSSAEQAGVRIGDCVLEANGEDLLGLKIVDIAKRVRNGKTNAKPAPGVNLMLWNSGFEKNNLNPQSLSRFASCLQSIAGLLECPVCLDIIRPPSWQCCHGHLICSGCRSKSTKCPICRVVLGRGRCIVADKLFNFLVQTLGQHDGEKRPAGQKSSNLQQISARLPLLSRDHRLCKQSLKLKANTCATTNVGLTAHRIAKLTPSSVPLLLQYCCPSGQPCGKMKNQHDILIHLQKSHQTSVVQYYAATGDQLSINFNESCVTCIVLVPECTTGEEDYNKNSSGHKNSFNGNCVNDSNKLISTAVSEENAYFFLAKFRCIEASSQALYWLWHLGTQEATDRYVVTVSDSHSKISWSGRPVSMRQNCKEVLKSKQFVKLEYVAKGLNVRIELDN
ncbi:uncharacterized protein LOC135704914 [Ochlerotatus camptorhynchus]|uniref:uncharacterized protein LOC135704914 n=1 Tax=Ochlerotatus camptorhynchus TaxID=644619 RepID=UPI0031D49B0C